MGGRLCATSLFLLLASAQARFIVLNDQEDGPMQSDTERRTGAESAWSTSNGGVLTMDSWHMANPLTWLLRGSLDRASSRQSVSAPETPSVDALLRHVRCSRLKAALAEYQAAMQNVVEGTGKGVAISLDRSSDGQAAYHDANRQAVPGYFWSHTHAEQDDPETADQHISEHAAQQMLLRQVASTQRTQHTTTTTTTTTRSGYDGSDWEDTNPVLSGSFEYGPDTHDDTEPEVEDAGPEIHPKAREAEELYGRGNGDAIDSYGGYIDEDEGLSGDEDAEADETASAKSVVSSDEAAALQRDLDGMLDDAGKGGDEDEDGRYERDDTPYSTSAYNPDSTSSIDDVSALVTHLLRGMVVAADHAQSIAAEAASDAAADAKADGDDVGARGAQAVVHDMLMHYDDDVLYDDEEDPASVGTTTPISHGNEDQAHDLPLMSGLMSDQGNTQDMLMVYPYDTESDDVFTLRGDPSRDGPHNTMSTMLFGPLSYAAHVMHDLAARVELLWALQQQQDAMAHAHNMYHHSASSGLLPRIMDDQVLLDPEDAVVHPLYVGHSIRGGASSHEDPSDLWMHSTESADDPMFLSSWWGPDMGGYVADAGHDEDVDGGADAGVVRGGMWAQEWALVMPDGEINLGVLLLCALLLATAAMSIGFVRSFWSLWRVMRQSGGAAREPLLVPFIVEGRDGVQQGYMLVDEEALLGAAAAAGLGKGSLMGAREWLQEGPWDIKQRVKEGLEVASVEGKKGPQGDEEKQ